ncbi:hypothetical protein ABPG74_015589 [Tetrahymena malaccensis]
MEYQNHNQQENNSYLNNIQKHLVAEYLCLISVIFLMVGLVQYVQNFYIFDYGIYVSMSFWGILGYYFICKTQAQTGVQNSQILKEELHKINASFLYCNYIFIIPMFFIQEMALAEKKDSFSFEVLFRQTSFYMSSLFCFRKQKYLQMLIQSVKNRLIQQTLNGLNIIITFLIISSFLFSTSYESINHKFIYSQFPFSLVFILISRSKHFKNVGIFLHIAYSIIYLLLSFEEISSEKNTPLIKQAYLFSIVFQVGTLISIIFSIIQNVVKNKKRHDLQLIYSQANQQDITYNQVNVSQAYFQINIPQLHQSVQETTDEQGQDQSTYKITLEEIEKIICTTNYVSDDKQIIYSQKKNQQKEQQQQCNISQCSDCPICQQDFQNEEKVYSLSCKHQYHATCLIEWIKMQNTCPLCRACIISSQQLQMLKDQTQNTNDRKQRSLLLIP